MCEYMTKKYRLTEIRIEAIERNARFRLLKDPSSIANILQVKTKNAFNNNIENSKYEYKETREDKRALDEPSHN